MSDVEALAVSVNCHFKNFGAVTRAVTGRAAQVHVREKLHFNVLEAVTAANRAAPIARVKTKGPRGVASGCRGVRGGEKLPDGIKGAHVASGIGACRFPNRGLVNEMNRLDFVGIDKRLVFARCFRGKPLLF